MTERERLFAWCVDEIDAGRLTFEQCARRYTAADPELVALLRTVRAARTLPKDEIQSARARVRVRVMASLDEVPTRQAPARPEVVTPRQLTPPAGGPPPRPVRNTPAPPLARRRAPSWRVAAIAAAVIVACGGLGWGAGNAAAASLPGEPLYAVKRAQEWVALRTAYSDQRRGEVIVSIADHRLAEATAEADQGSDTVARDLTREYDHDIQTAIGLSVAMAAAGEDNRAVLGDLAAELARAQTLLTRASSHGEQSFAQSLGNAVAAESQAIDHNHLKLPDSSTPSKPTGRPSDTPVPATAQPGGHGSPHPTPSPHGGGG